MGSFDFLKTPGGMMFALGVCVLVFFLAAFLVKGSVFVEYGLMPDLFAITRLALLVSIVALPLAFIKFLKPVARWAFLLSWLVFAITAWVLAYLVTFNLWGAIGIIVGLALAGIGIVPVGILAALLHGDWASVIELLVLVALAFGTRQFMLHLARQLAPPLPVGPMP